MPQEKICPICNNPFTIPPTRQNQKYCSRNCSVIGRKLTKETTASERVNSFIDSIPDLPILDVLEGKLENSTTNNRMNVKGARTWEGKRFLVIVTE